MPDSADRPPLDPAPDSADPIHWDVLGEVNRGSAGTLSDRMGIVYTEVGPQRVVATMPVAGNTQPYGLLHGGASVVLAESIGSVLAVVSAGRGRTAVGVDINATHHRPVTSGLVTGVAIPLHVGRTTASFDVVISDEAGRRVCSCRFTAQLRDDPLTPR